MTKVLTKEAPVSQRSALAGYMSVDVVEHTASLLRDVERSGATLLKSILRPTGVGSLL